MIERTTKVVAVKDEQVVRLHFGPITLELESCDQGRSVILRSVDGGMILQHPNSSQINIRTRWPGL